MGVACAAENHLSYLRVPALAECSFYLILHCYLLSLESSLTDTYADVEQIGWTMILVDNFVPAYTLQYISIRSSLYCLSVSMKLFLHPPGIDIFLVCEPKEQE